MSEYHKLYSLYSGRQAVELAAVERTAQHAINLYARVLHLPLESPLRREVAEVCAAVSDTFDRLVETDQLADRFRVTPPLKFSHRQGNVFHLAGQPYENVSDQ